MFKNLSKKIFCLLSIVSINSHVTQALPLSEYLSRRDENRFLDRDNSKSYGKALNNVKVKDYAETENLKIINGNCWQILISNIKKIGNWIKEWETKGIPPAVVKIFTEFNEECKKYKYEPDKEYSKGETEKIKKAHEGFKRTKVNNFDYIWMMPHGLHGGVYKQYLQDTNRFNENNWRQDCEKWKEIKSKRGTLRLLSSKTLHSNSNIRALEIGNIVGGGIIINRGNADIEQLAFRLLNGGSENWDWSILWDRYNEQPSFKCTNLNRSNELMRLVIVWDQDENGKLTNTPKLYLSKHYGDVIDVDQLELDK